MNRIALLATLLCTLLIGPLLSACGEETHPSPMPAGASAGLPTFRYFYTDN